MSFTTETSEERYEEEDYNVEHSMGGVQNLVENKDRATEETPQEIGGFEVNGDEENATAEVIGDLDVEGEENNGETPQEEGGFEVDGDEENKTAQVRPDRGLEGDEESRTDLDEETMKETEEFMAAVNDRIPTLLESLENSIEVTFAVIKYNRFCRKLYKSWKSRKVEGHIKNVEKFWIWNFAFFEYVALDIKSWLN